ncbi:hypothetical protein HLJ05_004602, partial [Salmonella enterica]|nr:hypothetical protein [Salmonella enterica]EHK5224885.1 hypothetical protein [Salmonella enterica]EIG0619743.1 hypothetical protein [Salmonella enterica]EJU6128551.1 hypothetical protein [Salmonella enterica]
PGAVTVTTPAQDTAGNVAATLTYVDTSGQLLSKAARTGTTSVSIGSAVKQTVDTRFYPQVHVCVTNKSASGFIVPGQTEVKICDGSGHAVPDGSGYAVTRPDMSQTGCTRSGGGVCPPDTAGVKADFTGLTGDDIARLVYRPKEYDISDTIANVSYKSGGPGGILTYYVLLANHHPAAALGGESGDDIFHAADAAAFCKNAPDYVDFYPKATFTEGYSANAAAGGTASVSGVDRMYIGRITAALKGGSDTAPLLFVAGGGQNNYEIPSVHLNFIKEQDFNGATGARFPPLLVMVNGSRSAAVSWSMEKDGVDMAQEDDYNRVKVSIGHKIAAVTQWNLSDMYFVNNWPGTPLTLHKPDKNDTTDEFVTQVNYVSGYVCNARLQ